MKSALGKNLTKYRKRRGMTQSQLAAVINVTPQAVSKWENGSLPDSEFLPLLSKALNVSIDVLFGIAEETEPPVPEQLLVDKIRQTPPEERADLVMQIFYSAMTAYHDYKLSLPKYPVDLELETYAEVKTDYECAIARLNEDLKYFCFVKIPENGINSYTEATDQMVRLFETLADKDAITILNYLGSGHRNRMQSLEYISKQVKISLNKVTRVMDKLDSLGLVWKVSAEISDTPSDVYGFVNSTPLAALLVLAKSLTRYIRFRDLYVDTWERAPFRYENENDNTGGKNEEN